MAAGDGLTGRVSSGALVLLLLLTGCLWIPSGDVARRLADADGDGYASEMAGGPDCDDGDGATHPGAEEICGDGIDQDCDRDAKDCRFESERSLSEIVLVGDGPGAFVGSVVALPGDVDGDGAPDMLIGAYGDSDEAGAGYLVHGPPGPARAASLAETRFHGGAPGDQAGFSLTGAGDVDGDGADDIVIGAPFTDGAVEAAGVACIFYHPPEGDVALADADAIVLGRSAYDNVGGSMVGAGDVNADGFADVLIGATGFDSDEVVDAGAAFLLYGPVTGTSMVDPAEGSVVGDASSQQVGGAMCGPGDMDGDGFDDIWVAAPGWDGPVGSTPEAGAAFMALGPVAGEVRLATADASLFSPNSLDYFGADLAGTDVDQDGYADLLVLAPGDDSGALDAGAVFLYPGPLTGTVAVSDYHAAWRGTSQGALFPQIRIAGDLDGDGWSDLVFSAGNGEEGGEAAGAARVVYGPLRSGSQASELLGREGDHAGWSVAGGSDLDADGLDDLLVGGYGHGADAGAAWFVAGSGP